MNLHLYDFSWEMAKLLIGIIWDSIRVQVFGIPRIQGNNPKNIARAVLYRNFHPPKLFYAGFGHFRYLWVSDFGVAYSGLSKLFPSAQIRPILKHMIDVSGKLGYMPTTLTNTIGMDLPYSRGDSFPWFLISIEKYTRLSSDTNLLTMHKPFLQILLNKYLTTHIASGGLIHDHIAGDWIDTIRRPSSTWNNVCLWKMLTCAITLGLSIPFTPKKFQDILLSKRYRNMYFIDHAQTKNTSIDGAVLLLYFQLGSTALRKTIAEHLLSLDIFDPYPLKPTVTLHDHQFIPLLTKLTAYRYHTHARWLHLGLMFLNGIKVLGMDVSIYKKQVDEIVMRYKNFIETVDENGQFYKGLISSEYGFTMAAAQYLELVS